MSPSKIRLLLLIFPLITGKTVLSQHLGEDSINRKRLTGLVAGATVGYTGTVLGLSEVWYSNFDRQPFTFFDDSREWLQVDKVGHFYSAFQISNASSRMLRWSGVSKRKSDKIAALSSFLMISTIEVFDGRSSGYGASISDLMANALGSGFYLGQQLLWAETRLHPKFSFHTTHFSDVRPDVLGNNLIERIVKDYNGQTYWLSIDVDKFATFPKWLNIAVGYGAHEFVYADKETNLINGYTPYRQYYLSLDFDLTAIKTRSKALKSLFQVLNMIKLPSPTFEFSKKGLKSYPFYF